MAPVVTVNLRGDETGDGRLHHFQQQRPDAAAASDETKLMKTTLCLTWHFQ